ncbi:MAG: hypothetical protein LBV08_04630 [Clostridiales bacterium]|nr:hypothetical protein [Clostridiales bacterium]
MASLLILSHSRSVADALRGLALELNPNASVFSVGGAKDGSAGADYDKMKETLEYALTLGDVIIFFDLGSTMLTIQMVIEGLPEAEQSKITLSTAALVEGTIAASACLAAGMPADEVLGQLEPLSINKF